jgi:hypothetical protein
MKNSLEKSEAELIEMNADGASMMLPKRASKKAYAMPQLSEYGIVAHMTQGNLSHGNDEGFGNSRKNP